MRVLFLAFLIFEAGCASVSAFSSDSQTLGPLTDDVSSRAFQKALKAEPGNRALEQARIDYLLERVSKTPYTFIRNNDRYTGKKAQAHLRWKYLRNLLKVKTAEDFIKTVATQSKMSGEPYQIEFPRGKRYRLASILYYELKGFDERVAKERERLIKAEAAIEKAPA